LRKKVLVRGTSFNPIWIWRTCRFVCRALRSREDLFDIHIIPVGWGQTGWIIEDDEERSWLDRKNQEKLLHTCQQQGGKFDMSIQVTIPNEWEAMAPANIGSNGWH
jgi:glutathionyl-hydroquinone reductase